MREGRVWVKSREEESGENGMKERECVKNGERRKEGEENNWLRIIELKVKWIIKVGRIKEVD